MKAIAIKLEAIATSNKKLRGRRYGEDILSCNKLGMVNTKPMIVKLLASAITLSTAAPRASHRSVTGCTTTSTHPAAWRFVPSVTGGDRTPAQNGFRVVRSVRSVPGGLMTCQLMGNKSVDPMPKCEVTEVRETTRKSGGT